MKYLILYASKHGATEEAARILKEKMAATGAHEILLENIKNYNGESVEEYDGIAVGSSIYAGMADKKIKAFISKNESVLSKKRVGIFICGSEANEEAVQKELVQNFGEFVKKIEITANFGYCYYMEKMGFLEKVMIKNVAKVTESESRLNEKAIEEFALKMTK